ncbi:hypothetical protein SAMN05216411_101169 [Nitrosospira multiformis]|nr:hypothetical protein SAMN05216411_101169 [Nitrosospira multiformis]
MQRKMQARVEEEKKLLGHYEEKSYLYKARPGPEGSYCSFIA